MQAAAESVASCCVQEISLHILTPSEAASESLFRSTAPFQQGGASVPARHPTHCHMQVTRELRKQLAMHPTHTTASNLPP